MGNGLQPRLASWCSSPHDRLPHPAHGFGGVHSVYRLLAYGSFPIGALAGGVIASNAGLGAPWLFAGTGTLTLLPWLAKALRTL